MKKKLLSAFISIILFPVLIFAQTDNSRTKKTKNPVSASRKQVSQKVLEKNKKTKNEAVVQFNEDFETGQELFSMNEPEKAIPFLEKAMEANDVNPAVYIYLGVAYYQTGDYNRSLAVCVQGLARENTDHKILAYNAGNSCYAMGNYLRADASYAIAIREDKDYAPAVLNRANAQLKLDHLEDSKNNYIKYLELDPETEQRERIELLIKLLEQEIELRSKQKPELINPDEFVENEKMEVGEIPEKVELEIPVYEEDRNEEFEIVSFHDYLPPEIPEEQLEIACEVPEVLADEKAPALPVEVIDVVTGEKIREKAPALPVEDKKAAAASAKEPDGERVSTPESDLPVEKAEDKEKIPEEKIDSSLIAVNDYEKEEREKLEAEKAEKERAESERKKLLKQIEKEQFEASAVKIDENELESKSVEVPESVEVKENKDGTVDIKIPTLSFRVNSSELSESPSNNETIKKVYEILSDDKYTSYKVMITGYVNPDGDVWTEDEKKLAYSRALSVKKMLVQMGISESRMEVKNGDGKSSDSEFNRRVEFLLSKTEKNPSEAK